VNWSEACEANKLQKMLFLGFQAVFKLFYWALSTTIPITCEQLISEH